MFERNPAFIARAFLRSLLGRGFEVFKNSGEKVTLLEQMTNWSNRIVRDDTADEASLIRYLFEGIWGYRDTGGANDHTLYPQHPVRSPKHIRS